MFRTVPLSIISSFSGSWSCSQAVSKTVWHIPLLCVQWKTADDGQRNCPKHVEFYSKIGWEISQSIWFYYKNLSRCTLIWTSNLWLHAVERDNLTFTSIADGEICVSTFLSLGAFAKLWRATVSIVMSFWQTAWHNSAPTGRIFMKIHI